MNSNTRLAIKAQLNNNLPVFVSLADPYDSILESYALSSLLCPFFNPEFLDDYPLPLIAFDINREPLKIFPSPYIGIINKNANSHINCMGFNRGTAKHHFVKNFVDVPEYITPSSPEHEAFIQSITKLTDAEFIDAVSKLDTYGWTISGLDKEKNHQETLTLMRCTPEEMRFLSTNLIIETITEVTDAFDLFCAQLVNKDPQLEISGYCVANATKDSIVFNAEAMICAPKLRSV